MITIESLSVSFGKLKVLNNINLEIQEGDFIAVYGPNGCGKTTLLNCLAGIINYKGRILINNKTPRNSKISMVFQAYSDSIFPWKNVLDNIVFPLKINNISNSRRNIAKMFLEDTILKQYLYYYPYQLSGGMQQLVNITRAFIYNPDVILLDEPFSSLDINVKDQTKSELINLWKKMKFTIILVTHDLDEAISMANKIIILSNKPSNIIKIYDNNKLNPNIKNEILKNTK